MSQFFTKGIYQFMCSLLMLLPVINKGIAQEINTYSFEQLTKTNGLPSNMVYQINKDKNGFIWIATNDGLIRFDGVNERIYQHDPNADNTISGNIVRSLLYDTKGQLWVGTVGNGLNLYNQETDDFTKFLSKENDYQTLSNNDVLCIFEDSKNRIWVGTEGGLNLYNPENHSFKRFVYDANNPKSIGANSILKIFEDSKGHIWVGTWDGGLNLLIPEKNNNFSFLSLKKDETNPTSITSNHIWDFVEDNNNRLWLSTFDGGLVTFDMPEGDLSTLTAADFKFKSYNVSLGDLKDNRLFSIAKDNKGDIWLGTSLGLGIFDPNTIDVWNDDEPKSLFHTTLWSDKGEESLPHNEIRNLYFDADKDIMWVSTFGGIAYHFMSDKKFKFSSSPIKDQIVRMVIQSQDDDIQYIGLSSQGLVEYNKKTKTYKRYQHPTNNSNFDIILSMAAFGDTVWIGSRGGLSIFDTRTKKLEIIENLIDVKNIDDFSIIKFLKDSKERVWLATTIGLIQTDLSLSKVQLYRPDRNNPDAISDEMVTDIEEDRDGNLWVITCGGGLDKLTFNDKGHAIFKSYNTSSRKENKPATNLLIFGEIDEENNIWLGTEVGIIKYNITKDEFTNNLPFGRSRVFGLALVNGNVWFTDSDGLTKYNIEEDRASKYNVSDGLQSGGFLHYSYFFEEKNHQLFFGGADGYQLFNPDDIVEDKNLSPLLITNLKIFNTSIRVNEVDQLTKEVILKENITATKAINLSYLHTSITFCVTPLDYESSNRYLFAYKLEGLEDEWKYTTDTEINYSRLPHGRYLFLAKAKNSDGVWSPERKLEIRVKPPFWKRIDFIFLVSLMILLSIVGFIYNKIKKVNLEKENLENLVLDTSTGLSNEIQNSLSTEDILRENKIFFEKLYAESPLGIAFTDGDFNIIKFNKKFKSTFRIDTLKDQQIFDFIVAEKWASYLLLIKSLIEKQEKTFRQDIPYEINEELVWLNTAFSFLYDNEGELRYAIIKVSDVTARKMQEKMIQSLMKEIQGKNEELEEKVTIRTQDLENTNEKLIAKNQELARFAYIASHDLKEPLRNILSFVGLINRRTKKEVLSEEITEYLNFIKLNTHQMHTIVNDVLEYSNFSQNEFELEKVDLNNMFHDIKLILAGHIMENNAVVIIPELPSINSNRGFLFLLIKNLIENGIKYNENEIPKIEILFEEDETQYIIKVKDNGIGIEAEYHEQIFEMFKRLHTREVYKGSGLGLSICKKIVEKMDGRLELESKLGEGSTFMIYHPKY